MRQRQNGYLLPPAHAARSRRKNEERNGVIDAGEAILVDMIGRLKDLAQQNAPEARIQGSHAGKLNIAVGQAELAIELHGDSTRFPTSECEMERASNRTGSSPPSSASRVETWSNALVHATGNPPGILLNLGCV